MVRRSRQVLIPVESGFVRGLWCWLVLLGASAFGVGEAVGVAVAGEDVGVVGEAIKECAGEALAAKDLGPFVEGEVAGDEGGAAFVALGEDFELNFPPFG